MKAWVALVLALASAACTVSSAAYATSRPPIAKPPQFILVSHDDGLTSDDANTVRAITDKYHNPTGCRLPVTWYVCTKGCSGMDCKQVRSLYQRGDEIADHTVHHNDLSKMSYGQIYKEWSDAKKQIAACGIPPKAIVGARAPYLADSPDMRAALANQGFRYDSSVGAKGGSNRQWPAPIKGGFPYDCSVGGNNCSPSENYSSLWEIPLWETPLTHNLMDYCTDESTGRPLPHCDPYTVLKSSFDQAYSSNRGPVGVAIHTPYLKNRAFATAVSKFLAYAMSKQDVWAVTYAQLLDWMEKPVPASQMKAFMHKYACA